MRLGAVGLLAAGMLVGAARPVAAAAPSNDLSSGATVVTALPFAEELDTTEATTDEQDGQFANGCGAPAIEATVWYRLTSAATTSVIVDLAGSDYPAGVLIGTGEPGDITLITCAPGRVVFPVSAGETYWILAFDFSADGQPGGILQIAIDEAGPPPEINVTVDPVGSVDGRTGVASITGTYTCLNSSAVFVSVGLNQVVGRFTVNGFGAAAVDQNCDGASHTWSAALTEANGKFAGGKAEATVVGFACAPGMPCAFDTVEQQIRLRGGA
jgi:hypothetical protein